MTRFLYAGLLATVASAMLAGCGGGGHGDGAERLQAKASVLSTRAEYVTGGDALLKVDVPSGVTASDLKVTLNDKDVTSSFSANPAGGPSLVGLVSGLANGSNKIRVNGSSVRASELTVTNYPITGPVFSGPHITPFVCQTQEFVLPDGTKLPASSDPATCAVPTVVQYVYLPVGGAAFRPIVSATALPSDVASTTTSSGATVPFVVRVETGTVDRGIYQFAVLHDPTKEAQPTPAAPPKAWNRRAIAIQGFGCPAGWYTQGAAIGNISGISGGMRAEILDVARLGQGYATHSNTLQHASNNCNAVLASEAALMTKERFIETFGMPAWTVSHGCSGGSYGSTQPADRLPGLYDGVLIACTFPDPLAIAFEGQDSHLLTHYWAAANPGGFTDAQKIAVTGYKSVRAFTDAANQAGRTDPISGRVDVLGYTAGTFNAAVPVSARYNPGSNPTGARATVFDASRNIYGTDTKGFALRPFDNVGVQYGLNALLGGAITIEQFLDLNEKVGGYDQDANYVTGRSVGDIGAIRRAKQAGLQLGGNGGLAEIPVFDVSGIYNDESGYHYQWFHFATRERLRQANGDTGNHVMWRGAAVPYDQAWATFVQWVEKYKADPAADTQRAKVIRAKPTADGCFDAGGTFIAETQTFSSQSDLRCNTLYPSYGATRLSAGGPLSADVVKCQLKPITPTDYAGVIMTATQMARLNAIFSNGVCEWSKGDASDQKGVVPYGSFGPSPVNLLFNIAAQ